MVSTFVGGLRIPWLPTDSHCILQEKQKIGCVAANPRLLHGKPLYYGPIGLMMGNIYLTSKINVILAMGNIIVALRGKADATSVLCKRMRLHNTGSPKCPLIPLSLGDRRLTKILLKVAFSSHRTSVHGVIPIHAIPSSANPS